MGKYFYGICDSSVAGAMPGCVSSIGNSACLATTPAPLGTVLRCLLGDVVVTSLVFFRQVARLGNATVDTRPSASPVLHHQFHSRPLA